MLGTQLEIKLPSKRTCLAQLMGILCLERRLCHHWTLTTLSQPEDTKTLPVLEANATLNVMCTPSLTIGEKCMQKQLISWDPESVQRHSLFSYWSENPEIHFLPRINVYASSPLLA